MKFENLNSWIEGYFYNPSILQRAVSILFLPLTAIYCTVVITKRVLCKSKDFDIPIISIGNLTVGGSGKTPFLIEVAKRYEDVFVILRGYKRESKDIIIVSKNGEILTDVKKSGDEAMLIAKSLPKASVIVSKDRIKAIRLAKENKAKVIFLDDAFHRCEIKKFDILIKRNLKNSFCLPSGPYREPKSFEKYADLVVEEGKDFKRVVNILNPTKNMLLVTAIANPKRLDKYIPKNIKKIYFEDHHFFTKEEIKEIINKFHPTSLLVTQKDAVKLENFNLNLSILDLKLKIDRNILKKIDKYIKDYYAKENTDSSNAS
ncbi:tetraacyldisaccharide 4'-kinase [Nitrosophilus kaiyonis]|uniref:tetraacyldisaccharide 4'-kinase n=1 Tax=Nitrosophilus kaiyonis TaxID=2930200 RepID=UPI0024937E20|nr:tetraacyldisaccharide 4'-kinase [Nitrosophilus kaiyonis]